MDLTIDLQGRGRQHGVLRVGDPRMDDRWASIDVPLLQIGSGRPPFVALLADGRDVSGTHALAEFARTVDPARLRGTLRVVPTLDPRLLRCAPHLTAGAAGLQRRVIDAVATAVVADASLVIDIGGGEGASRRWCRAAVVDLPVGARRAAPELEAAMVAFGADFSLRLHDSSPHPEQATGLRPDLCLGDEPDALLPEPDPPSGVRSPLADWCHRFGVARLSTRGHGAGDIDALLIGCRNVLVQRDQLDEALTLRASRQLVASREGRLIAPRDGLLEPRLRPGHEVHAGDTVARLLDPGEPAREPQALRSPRDGLLAAIHRGELIARGDTVALLAEEVQG